MNIATILVHLWLIAAMLYTLGLQLPDYAVEWIKLPIDAFSQILDYIKAKSKKGSTLAIACEKIKENRYMLVTSTAYFFLYPLLRVVVAIMRKLF